MTSKTYTLTTSSFQESVDSLISTLKGSHIWLTSVKNMTLSKMNLEIIQEDMNLFKKFVAGKIVLDFGAGSGFVSSLLAADSYWVSGVDVNNYLEYDKNKYNKSMAQDQISLWKALSKKIKNLSFIHYSKTIPFKDDTFDAVCAYAVLEHIPVKKVPATLKEITRVLKPGGTLFISRLPRVLSYSEHFAKFLHLGSHEKLYGDSEITRVLTESGLDIVKMEYEEIFPAYPESLTNILFPLISPFNKLLLRTPLKYFSHHLRLVCKSQKK